MLLELSFELARANQAETSHSIVVGITHAWSLSPFWILLRHTYIYIRRLCLLHFGYLHVQCVNPSFGNTLFSEDNYIKFFGNHHF